MMKKRPGPKHKAPGEKYIKIGVSVPPEMRRFFDEKNIKTTKYFQDAVESDSNYQEWLKADQKLSKISS